jgi:hypothetical protein
MRKTMRLGLLELAKAEKPAGLQELSVDTTIPFFAMVS